jgi:phosphate uptake regulator
MEQEGRLVKVGGSLMVTLPLAWVRFERLEAGALLKMNYDEGAVTIRPVKGTNRRKA